MTNYDQIFLHRLEEGPVICEACQDWEAIGFFPLFGCLCGGCRDRIGKLLHWTDAKGADKK